MKNLVYSVNKFCKYCKEDIPINLYSDDPNFIENNPDGKKEIDDWGLHYHWIEFHRICARCGEIVKGDDLEVVPNSEVKWKVHNSYVKEARGREIELLSVHINCLE